MHINRVAISDIIKSAENLVKDGQKPEDVIKHLEKSGFASDNKVAERLFKDVLAIALEKLHAKSGDSDAVSDTLRLLNEIKAEIVTIKPGTDINYKIFKGIVLKAQNRILEENRAQRSNSGLSKESVKNEPPVHSYTPHQAITKNVDKVFNGLLVSLYIDAHSEYPDEDAATLEKKEHVLSEYKLLHQFNFSSDESPQVENSQKKEGELKQAYEELADLYDYEDPEIFDSDIPELKLEGIPEYYPRERTLEFMNGKPADVFSLPDQTGLSDMLDGLVALPVENKLPDQSLSEISATDDKVEDTPEQVNPETNIIKSEEPGGLGETQIINPNAQKDEALQKELEEYEKAKQELENVYQEFLKAYPPEESPLQTGELDEAIKVSSNSKADEEVALAKEMEDFEKLKQNFNYMLDRRLNYKSPDQKVDVPDFKDYNALLDAIRKHDASKKNLEKRTGDVGVTEEPDFNDIHAVLDAIHKYDASIKKLEQRTENAGEVSLPVKSPLRDELKDWHYQLATSNYIHVGKSEREIETLLEGQKPGAAVIRATKRNGEMQILFTTLKNGKMVDTTIDRGDIGLIKFALENPGGFKFSKTKYRLVDINKQLAPRKGGILKRFPALRRLGMSIRGSFTAAKTAIAHSSIFRKKPKIATGPVDTSVEDTAG